VHKERKNKRHPPAETETRRAGRLEEKSNDVEAAPNSKQVARAGRSSQIDAGAYRNNRDRKKVVGTVGGGVVQNAYPAPGHRNKKNSHRGLAKNTPASGDCMDAGKHGLNEGHEKSAREEERKFPGRTWKETVREKGKDSAGGKP